MKKLKIELKENEYIIKFDKETNNLVVFNNTSNSHSFKGDITSTLFSKEDVDQYDIIMNKKD